MKVKEFATRHSFVLHADDISGEAQLTGLYATDLLSWVMGHSQSGQGWVTVQTHVNIVAVALLRELSCIIIAEGASIPQETLDRAKEEQIPIMQSDLPVYEICALFAKDNE